MVGIGITDREKTPLSNSERDQVREVLGKRPALFARFVATMTRLPGVLTRLPRHRWQTTLVIASGFIELV